MKKIKSMNYKIIVMALLIVAMGAGVMVGLGENKAKANTYIDPNTNIIWNYTVDSNGNANGLYTSSNITVAKLTDGSLVIPSVVGDTDDSGASYPVVSVGEDLGVNGSISSSTFLKGEKSVSFTISFANGSQVTTINPYAFYNCTTITSVALPESVTEIGTKAFYNCADTVSVTGMDNVVKLGDEAFSGCTSLTAMTLDKVVDFGNDLFTDCTSLKLTITNPNMDLSNQDFTVGRIIGYTNSTAREYYETKYPTDTSERFWRSLDGTDGYATKSFKVNINAGDGVTLTSGMFKDTYYGLSNGTVENLTAVAEKFGYTLDGYFVGDTKYYAYDSVNNVMVAAQATLPVLTEDTLTMNAKFTANKYDMTYQLNGGSWKDSVSADLSSTNKDKYTYDAGKTLNTNVTRKGYTFGGWWNGSGVVLDVDTSTCLNYTYVALWDDNSKTATKVLDIDGTADTENNTALVDSLNASDCGYYFTQLTQVQKQIYATLFNNYKFVPTDKKIQTVSRFSISSDSEITMVDAQNAQAALVWDHPEIFWVRSFAVCRPTQTDGKWYCMYVPVSAYSQNLCKGEAESYYGYLQTALEKIAISDADTTYTKVKKIHDYIINRYEYNSLGYTLNANTSNDTRSVGRMLSSTVGCCEGYARLTKVFCDYYNIPCVLVTSADHMWNEINVDGQWYGYDVTWDDSLSSDAYFLKGAATFSQDVHHKTINSMFINSDGTPLTEYACFPAPAITTDYVLPSDKNNGTENKDANNNSNKNGGNTVAVPGKNTVATVGSLKYKVTKSASKNGTVSVCGVKSKSIKTILVPATVKIKGYTFKVTAIANNAFKNCKKATKATISTNVTNIGKNAFYGAKKLKTLTVKSTKVTKVGSGAIKNIYKKATIKVPKSKKAKYKKLFKSSTGFKKTMKLK